MRDKTAVPAGKEAGKGEQDLPGASEACRVPGRLPSPTPVLSTHCHPLPNANSDRPWPCVQHHCLIKRCMVASCFMGLCAHIPLQLGDQCSTTVGREMLLYRSLNELVFPAPLRTLRSACLSTEALLRHRGQRMLVVLSLPCP